MLDWTELTGGRVDRRTLARALRCSPRSPPGCREWPAVPACLAWLVGPALAAAVTAGTLGHPDPPASPPVRADIHEMKAAASAIALPAIQRGERDRGAAAPVPGLRSTYSG